MTTLMDDGVDVVSRVIGNAVVIHRSAAMTEQAQEIALRVAPDNEHDLVVVDLPPGSSPAAWGRVAEILPRRRRGVRLILGDRSREAKALAAQLLAERINRTVVAPDGMIHPGVDGALFVDSGPGSGWVRCQPGCAPQWISKRFPRPAWDVSEVSRPVATSASGIAEPVLGGVWIRPVGDDEPLRQHRERLQENLPCQHEVFTVVLGCPGTRAITMNDVARFWVNLPAAVRPRARFVGYGPVNTPAPGLGQALADFLDERVVCYTGLPVASSEFPQVVTVRPDGAWGWNSPAREVAYRPGRGDEPPELLSYRAPLDDVMEVRPAVYWYAPDAVVEVIPAGLWVRRAIGGVGATMVRARQIDAEHLLVVFDTATDAVQRRMRMLAADMVAWLDEATRRTAVLVGAHEVAASAVPAAQPAGADVGEQPQARRTVYNGRITIEDAAPAEPARYDLEPLFDGVTPALPAAGPPAGTVIPVEAPQPAARLPTGVSSALAVPAPVAIAPAGAPPDPRFALDPPVAPDLPNLPDQRFVPAVAGRPAAAERPSAGVPEPPAPAAPSIEDGSAFDAGAARGGGARLQQAPAGNVAALIAPRGLEEERIWLRKAFGRQYAAMANSVARVLSEHPGFHDAMAASSGAVLTDAVSVRLYLSPEGDEIDQLLRLGKGGPHVPFARCVVSGLSRLPSHRGPTLYRITPTAAQWEKYRQRSLITDWGFMHALTTPCAEQDGDADVFLWSITGRRTRLLEPERESVAGRVLFVPGSNFKILDVREPAGGERAHILLRELAVAEVGPDGQVRDRGLGLDEMATESLRRAREAWAGAKPPHRLPESARPRFQALPGLV